MKKHRVMSCPPIDNKPERHIFLEMTPDSWLEVKGKITHEAIHEYLENEEKTGIYSIRMDTKYLRLITKVGELREEEPIT